MPPLDSRRQATHATVDASPEVPSLAKVAVVGAEAEPGERLRRGFERVGAEACRVDRANEVSATMPDPDVIVTVTRDRGGTIATLAALRAVSKSSAPILVIGGGCDRATALKAGAEGWVANDSEPRDIVTAATLLWRQAIGTPLRLETMSGAYYLARSLHAQRRSCVVTITRGLRRGELVFVDGELSRAVIGMLHGLSAFHQLLLWTRGALEIRDEQVIPHGEIPLSPEELYAEAKRFLAEVREAAGPVTPAAVYEQDVSRAQTLLASAPEPVLAVWRLFDGSRTVADIVEDSPYRMVETFRIAAKLAETQAIARCVRAHRRSRAQAILALEEWLTDAREPGTQAAQQAPVDWSDVVPFVAEPPLTPASPVVPSSTASGEIHTDPGTPKIDPAEKNATATEPAMQTMPGVGEAAPATEPKIEPAAAAADPVPAPEPKIEPELSPTAADSVPDPEPKIEPELSPTEAAFFERGEAIERNPPPVDTFEDLETPPDPEGTRKHFWSRRRHKG